MEPVWAVLGIAAIICLAGLVALLARRSLRRVSIPDARRLFEQQVDQLKSSFFQAAAASGKPRGLTWKSCEFGKEGEFARDLKTGELLALLPVTIGFEAVPGSEMEGVAAVGNLRYATAVFTYRRGMWATSGRAVFNMNPQETLRHFHNQYERVHDAAATN